MSTPEDDPENPISQFHKDLQHTEAKPQSAGRSAADDIIEVIGDFAPKKPRTKNACPSCESVEISTSYPLGGAARNRCKGCGHLWLGGPKSPAKLVLAKNGPAQTSVAGPYYRGSASRTPQDKHSPKSRLKAKSLKNLKNKE